MRMTQILIAAMVLATPVATDAQEGWGQISFENRTTAAADFYVDGDYGCRALAGLSCTVQARVGVHTLSIQTVDGRSASQPGAEVVQGGVFTWTVSEG